MFLSVVCVLIDLLFMFLSSAVVLGCRFALASNGGIRQSLSAVFHRPDLALHVELVAVFSVVLLLAMQGSGLYEAGKTRSFSSESRAVAKAVGLASLVLTAIIYISGTTTVSRIVVLSVATLNLFTFLLWRLWYRGLLKRRVAEGVGLHTVLIVGTGTLGQAIARHLEENKQLGYVVKGFVESDHRPTTGTLGHIDDLSTIVRANFVDEVVITPPVERDAVGTILRKARSQGVDVTVVPDFGQGMFKKARWNYLGDHLALELYREPIPVLGLLLKKIADLVLASLALIVTSPLLFVCALAIRLESSGPILYRSWRIGRSGRRFVCYKLRTMVPEADELRERLLHLNERQGVLFKIANDPRMTRIGKFLRKYSIDEIPQFWNVLLGDMSVVGPRPALVAEYNEYSPEHLRRLDVLPGITGLWQVRARHDPSFDNYVALDLEYIEHWSLWLDVKILAETIPVALKGTGR